MAIMATEVDPGGLMPRAILKAADFCGARVLEVGAGDGRLTFQYAEQPESVVGIDTKEADIRVASRRADAEVYGRPRFFCASGSTLPFTAGQFEVVLLASSL